METLVVVTNQLSLFQRLTTIFNAAGYQVKSCYRVDQLFALTQKFRAVFIIWDLETVSLEQVIRSSHQLHSTDHLLPQLVLAHPYQSSEALQAYQNQIDDYVAHTITDDELMARVKQRIQLYRRIQAGSSLTAQKQVYQLGDSTIDVNRKIVKKAGKTDPLGLTPKEFNLLVYFLHHPNQVLSREQLIRGVWSDFYVSKTSRMLEMHISHLRDKIEVDPKNPQLIVTVRGFGYQLLMPQQ